LFGFDNADVDAKQTLYCALEIVESDGRTIKTSDGLPSPTWISDYLKEDSTRRMLARPKNSSVTRANTNRLHASGAATRKAHFDVFNEYATKGTLVGIGTRC